MCRLSRFICRMLGTRTNGRRLLSHRSWASSSPFFCVATASPRTILGIDVRASSTKSSFPTAPMKKVIHSLFSHGVAVAVAYIWLFEQLQISHPVLEFQESEEDLVKTSNLLLRTILSDWKKWCQKSALIRRLQSSLLLLTRCIRSGLSIDVEIVPISDT